MNKQLVTESKRRIERLNTLLVIVGKNMSVIAAEQAKLVEEKDMLVKLVSFYENDQQELDKVIDNEKDANNKSTQID